MNEKPKLHPCSLEHYDRYRLRGPSGAIVAVGSYADMNRMTTGRGFGKKDAAPVEGELELFGYASR